MSIAIPQKSLLSFGKKQFIDTFARLMSQVESYYEKTVKKDEALTSLKNYFEYCSSSHPSDYIQKLSQNLLAEFPRTKEEVHRTVLLLERLGKKDLKDEDFLISTEDDHRKESVKKFPVYLILDNLRSSFNVGSLFRSAESFGISKVYLCGYTPTPDNSKTAKSALGTDQWVEWEYVESVFECISRLKKEGIQILAFETEKSAVDIVDLSPSSSYAVILGNERYGLSEEILKESDQIIRINTEGRKNSLNVGVCGSIAMYHLVRQLS